LVVTCALTFAAPPPQEAKATISIAQPTQIPGSVLFPGSYIFKSIESYPGRIIVQVTDEQGTLAFATFLAVPSNAIRPSETRTLILFSSRPAKKFPAVLAWLPAGQKSALQFVYDKELGTEIAKDVHSPVLVTNTTSDQVKQLKAAPIDAVLANGQLAEAAQALQNATEVQAAVPHR
jgi:hypothetical protein